MINKLQLLMCLMLMLCGCASNSNKPLLNSLATYVPIRVQLIDYISEQPLPNVDVSRLDPIPNPESLWSRMWYGNSKAIATKIGTTDKQGMLSISGEHRESEYKFLMGRDTFAFHCGEQYELRLIRGERVVPFENMMRKNEAGVLQIFVPQGTK